MGPVPSSPETPGSPAQFFGRLLDEAPVAVYVYDAADRFTYVNRRFQVIFDQPPSSFVGRHPGDVFAEDVARELVANNAAVRREGRNSFREELPHAPDGDVHIYATEKFPLGEDCVAGVSVDICELAASEATLRRRDIVLQAIAASAADMVSVHDLGTGRVRWISDGVRELLGYDPEDVIGTLPDAWVAYEEPATMVRHHSAGADAGRPERSVQRVRRRDGTTTWIEVHTQPVRVPTEDGETWVSVAITRDVGDRHAREQDLRAELEIQEADLALFERVLRSVADPIAITDLESGTTVFTNCAMAEAMTATPSAWKTEDEAEVSRLQCVDDADDQVARVASCFEHEDGRQVPVEVLVQRMEHHGRELEVRIARDVSLQKESQERLQSALAREHEALRRLEAINELRAKMVTSISHEVRTPLTSIHGIAQTLRRARSALEPAMVDHLLDRLAANSTRLDVLLEGFLDIEGVTKEEDSLALVPTQLRAEVRHVLQRTPLGPRPIDLQLDDVTAAVDVRKFRRIVTNLLDNVLRHTPPDTAVGVSLGLQDEHVVLQVADDGPGIPARLRERVFEPFERYTPPDRDHNPGLGLGLSLVQLYTRMHGGRCELDSGATGGATFRVLLPVQAAAT